MSDGEEEKGQYIVIPRREFLFFSLCAIVLFVRTKRGNKNQGIKYIFKA